MMMIIKTISTSDKVLHVFTAVIVMDWGEGALSCHRDF